MPAVADPTPSDHPHTQQRTLSSCRPYLKGLMPSLESSVASEAPTLSPALIRFTSDTISMVPLLILVAIPRAYVAQSEGGGSMEQVRPGAYAA